MSSPLGSGPASDVSPGLGPLTPLDVSPGLGPFTPLDPLLQDFDRRVMDFMLKQFKKKTGADATKDKRALQKLRREARHAHTLPCSPHASAQCGETSR